MNITETSHKFKLQIRFIENEHINLTDTDQQSKVANPFSGQLLYKHKGNKSRKSSCKSVM